VAVAGAAAATGVAAVRAGATSATGAVRGEPWDGGRADVVPGADWVRARGFADEAEDPSVGGAARPLPPPDRSDGVAPPGAGRPEPDEPEPEEPLDPGRRPPPDPEPERPDPDDGSEGGGLLTPASL